MCDVLPIVQQLLIPFNTLDGSGKIMKFFYESIFSMISSVLPIATASVVNVGAILAILNFLLTRLS
jgi:Zn-dependent protease